MGIVVQSGSINTQSLLAPNVIVQIQPPSVLAINGVPSNIIGVVGSAQWGLKNSPVIVGNMNEYAQNFGFPQPILHDMGTAVFAATLNLASSFICVRVTDGTDTAAAVPIVDVTTPTHVTGFTATGIYTGTLGNSINVTVSAGSALNTFRVTVSLPSNLSAGLTPEIFDNIPGTGLPLWQNIVNAINMGQSGVRGPSNLIIATIGTATAAPALASYTLVGGTNGGIVTTANLIGTDVSPRTGMYTLRGTQSSVAMLTDLSDSASYAEQVSFGISEGVFIHLVGPPGQTLSAAKTAKDTIGIDNYDAKFLIGDWCYILDTFNGGITRLISPQGFACGRKSNLAANRSALNKPILGIVGTQTTQSGGSYSNPDIVFLCDNGMDVIYNPSPGGNYFSLQTGQNTSSNILIRMDAYTTLTNYLAYSIAGALGGYIGQLQTPTIRNNAKSSLYNFLYGLFQQGFIGDVNFPNEFSKAVSIVLNDTNNPETSVALGYMQADIQIVDYSVIRNFIVNLQNGQPSLQSTIPA